MQRTCTQKVAFWVSEGLSEHKSKKDRNATTASGRDEQHRLDHEGTRSETHCLITRLSEQRSVSCVGFILRLLAEQRGPIRHQSTPC